MKRPNELPARSGLILASVLLLCLTAYPSLLSAQTTTSSGDSEDAGFVSVSDDTANQQCAWRGGKRGSSGACPLSSPGGGRHPETLKIRPPDPEYDLPTDDVSSADVAADDLTAAVPETFDTIAQNPFPLTPGMLGDSFFTYGQIVGKTPSNHGGLIDIPGMRRAKIAENNSPLPRDRVYFTYQHFHNALTGEDWEYTTSAPQRFDFDRDRYVIGIEKTFLDGCFSAEVRLPLQESLEFNASPWPGFENGLFTARTGSGTLGNVSLAFKALLHASCNHALTAGLLIDLPTGPDVLGSAGYIGNYRLNNEAVHLGPFVGAVYRPNNCWFFQGFMQIDVDTNGNSFDWTGSSSSVELGVVQDQTLMYLDLSAGRWLLRRPRQCLLTGLAGFVEFHYTTTLEDADQAGIVRNWDEEGYFYDYLLVGNLYNRVDVMNLTAGFHAEFCNQTTARVFAVAPMQEEESNRTFDFELGVQLNWNF